LFAGVDPGAERVARVDGETEEGAEWAPCLECVPMRRMIFPPRDILAVVVVAIAAAAAAMLRVLPLMLSWLLLVLGRRRWLDDERVE